TPAAIVRTLGSTGWVLGAWAIVGLLSAAGALSYAELGTRFPEAGGGYVFLREAYGERCAFVYGWMSLLVMDPGITAALGVGLARYLLVLFGAPSPLVPAVAIACIVTLSGVTVLGLESSARALRWTAAAKLVTVVYAGLSVAFIHVVSGPRPATDEAFVVTLGSALFGPGAARLLAAAVVVAVAGSLAAVLLGAPRVYLAMARTGVFPAKLVR